MTNIYFPDEPITFNDLYFVCYMIERTARSIKQRNRYVVERMGKEELARQLSIAETNHCLNPHEVVDCRIAEYGLQMGEVDVTKVDARFTDKVPSETQMGKVYARLVSSIAADGNYVDGICNVYASPICDAMTITTRAHITNQPMCRSVLSPISSFKGSAPLPPLQKKTGFANDRVTIKVTNEF